MKNSTLSSKISYPRLFYKSSIVYRTRLYNTSKTRYRKLARFKHTRQQYIITFLKKAPLKKFAKHKPVAVKSEIIIL